MHNRELKKSYKGADHAAMRILLSLPWKGNVRELDNILERAMILGNDEWITPAELPRSDVMIDETQSGPVGHRLKESVAAYEKSLIESALHDTKGDRTRAAELLGLSRSSLYRKAEQLSIVLPQEKKVSP